MCHSCVCRLKKQELASFAESARDLLKSVEESAKVEVLDTLESPVEAVSEKSQKPPERAKILISVQDKDGTKQIRMYMVYQLFCRYSLCINVLNILWRC